MALRLRGLKAGKPIKSGIHSHVDLSEKEQHMKRLYVIHPVIHQPEWYPENPKRRIDWSLWAMIAVTVLYAAVALWLF